MTAAQPRRRQRRPDRRRAARPARALRARRVRGTRRGPRPHAARASHVPFFGHPAPIPAGPALLALETGAPDLRRLRAPHRGRPLPRPARPRRRRRRRARGASGSPASPPAIAAAFEAILADAPEQWWGAFHPIWPDLTSAPTSDAADAADRPARRRPRDRGPDRAARPRRPPHPHARVGRHGVGRRDPGPRRARRPCSTSSRSPTTSGSTPRSPPAHMAEDRGLPFEVVVGEEISDPRRPPPRAVPRAARPAARSLRWSIAAVHDQGGIADPGPSAGARTRSAPRARCCARCSTTPTPRVRPDAHRDVQPDGARPLLARAGRRASPTEHGLPRIGSSDAHAVEAVGTGWTGFPGRTADDLRAAILAGATTHHGGFHGSGGQLGTFGRQLRKYGRDARAEVGGRVRRDGTGRDHGYPGRHHRPPRVRPPTRSGTRDEDRPRLARTSTRSRAA